MPKRMLVLLLLVFVTTVSFHSSGKQTTEQDNENNNVTVYVYKTPHQRTLGRVAPPVYCDEQLLAKLDGGRYFIVKLEPGTHSFRSKNKKDGGVELELKLGQEYFLRMETRTGVQVNAPRISVVPNEEGRYDVKQMKYVNDGDIKDRSKVIAPSKEEKK
jgi:hypothetical protein